MKKLLATFLCATMILGITGCGSDTDSKAKESNNSSEEKVEINKTYTTGDTVTYTDDSGTEAFSFTIDSVKNMPNDNTAIDEFGEDEQPIEVTYTYKVINLPDVEDAYFLIPPANISVANEDKNVTNHSFSRMSEYPNGVEEGYSETVTAYYGLKSESKKAYITYNSRDFIGDFEFECIIK